MCVCVYSIYVPLVRWLFIKLVIPHQNRTVHPSSTENKYACRIEMCKKKRGKKKKNHNKIIH